MTPDERELRRALEARSGEPTPAFRARLSAALAEGRRPATSARQAIALVVAVLLAVGTVAVLLVVRQGPGLVPGGSTHLLPYVRHLSPAPPSAQPSRTAQATPSALPTPPPPTAELDAPSASVVWALVGGSELFRSTDRGGTWQQRPLPEDPGPMGNVSFLDDAQGWLLSVGSAATQCQFQLATVWHTTDAGATWQRMASTGLAGPQCKGGMSFVDPTHGFVGTADPNHRPVIYRTVDGGRTWTASSPLPDPPGFTTQCCGITLRAGGVRLLGSTLLAAAAGPADFYVFRSTDGGASWTYLASVPHQASSIAFVTATRWLSLVSPGLSEETVDAGATWHPYASDYDQAATVAHEVVFADSQVGYAAESGSLQRTLDGGLHWAPLRTPGT